MTKEKIPSVLSFEKKLVPSDGYLYGTSWENKDKYKPLNLVEKSVRGTISNRLKNAVKNDPAKLNAEVEKANLQKVDSCSLLPNQDTLRVFFSLKILGGIEPCVCNDAKFKKSYTEAVSQYIKDHGFKELGKRYAINLANARFLWRNRVGAEDIEVRVKVKDSEDRSYEKTFNALKHDIKTMQCDDKNVLELGESISKTLASDNDFLLLEIECFAKLGVAQTVYPSEELVLDKGKGDKSKILYSKILDKNNEIAAFHEQKIGNALRSIDTWYNTYGEDDSAGSISIEPYGTVTSLGRAFRAPKEKKDFFTLFDRFILEKNLDDEEDQHYVMAVLIRGGIFGESDKEK